ncbi:Wall-associated receptor kinase-like 4 [Bienertia sinuspersici]
MWSYGKVVAINKSKVMNERLLNIYINEVVLLFHINHINVVSLLGCCLESEVPILIATNITNALAYLHSLYVIPIYHRDIKCSNILFDDKYKAKLSSLLILIKPISPQVHNSCYWHIWLSRSRILYSIRFIDKIDVYNFEVVLVELLMGQNAVHA